MSAQEESVARILAQLPAVDPPANGAVPGGEVKPSKSPVVRRVADVSAERVSWHWPSRIPFAMVTVLDGDPGLGKSTLMLDLAARTSTGSPMPDGHRPDGPAGVVLMSAEDPVAQVIRPRLEAAGADLNRVVTFDAVTGDDGVPRPPSLPGDIDLLRKVIEQARAVLVVVDVLMAYLHGSVNAHRDQDVRRAMHPLAVMAEATGAAVVVLRHLNKAPGGNPLYRGGGSIGIAGAARSALLVAPDPDDENRRVLAVVKASLAPIPEALGYRLVNDDEHECGRVQWLGTTSHTAAQLLAIPAGDEDRTAFDAAVEFLRELLAGGPVEAKTVHADASKSEISKRTLRRAKDSLKVTSRKRGQDGPWEWTLPDLEGGQASNGENLGHLGHLRPDQDFYGPEGAEPSEGVQTHGLDTFDTLGAFPDDEALDPHEADSAGFSFNGPGWEDRPLDPIPTSWEAEMVEEVDR